MTLPPQSTVRGVFTLGLAQTVSAVGALVLTVLLPRHLDDVGLGQLALALAMSQLAGLAADLGTSTFLAKEIAKKPGSTRQLLTAALLLRLPLSAASAGLVLWVAHAVGMSRETIVLLALLSLGLGLSGVAAILVACLQGLQRMSLLAGYTVISRVSYVGLAIVLLTLGFGARGVAAASVVAVLIGLMVLGPTMLRVTGGFARVSPSTTRLLVAGSAPFFVWQASLMVYGQVDAIMLALLTNDATVGWYSAAYRLISIPVFVPAVLATVMLPALTSLALKDRASFDDLLRRAVRATVVICLPVTVVLAVLPQETMEFLGYGSHFDRAVWPLVVLAPCTTITAVNMVVGTAVAAADRQRWWAAVGLAAAVVNPAVNMAAIPVADRLMANGAVGAGAVTTLCEVLILVAGLRLLPGLVSRREAHGHLVRLGLVSGAMVLGLLVTAGLPFPARLLAGGGSYAVACFALGMLRPHDIVDLRAGLVRRAIVPAS